MLSYPIDEAEGLLQVKLSAAKLSVVNCEEDLDFLREQITVSTSARRFPRAAATSVAYNCVSLQTMEVATARVYNWDVVQKRKEKADEEKAKKTGKVSGEGDREPNG